MRSSVELYDALAASYEEHFAVAHRRAYDDLAWELVASRLPAAPGVVVDAGCGVGRWARRFVDLGHRVVGIEPTPAMAARARASCAGARFSLREEPMEVAALPAGAADCVVAMGSLQYSADPAGALARMAGWLRPGGTCFVLVDSLVALALELVRAGRPREADERLHSRMGAWVQHDKAADLHLFDAERLSGLFSAAGLEDVEARGLLVGATALGRDELDRRLAAAYDEALAAERALAAQRLLADCGKQLLVSGRRPVTTTTPPPPPP